MTENTDNTEKKVKRSYWEKLLEKYDNEDLAAAVWYKIINEKDAEKIQSGKFDKERMTKNTDNTEKERLKKLRWSFSQYQYNYSPYELTEEDIELILKLISDKLIKNLERS